MIDEIFATLGHYSFPVSQLAAQYTLAPSTHEEKLFRHGRHTLTQKEFIVHSKASQVSKIKHTHTHTHTHTHSSTSSSIERFSPQSRLYVLHLRSTTLLNNARSHFCTRVPHLVPHSNIHNPEILHRKQVALTLPLHHHILRAKTTCNMAR